MVIAVAIDENVELIEQFAADITYPVLVDREHLLSELYAISNVPAVVWIDENGRVARPNASEFGTDTFSEFTGVTRESHMDQVRAWVRNEVLPDDAAFEVPDLSEDELTAHLHFRLGAHLARIGDADAATAHFDRAEALAPFDFTIVRAAMPLRGGDPFGPEFFELYERYKEAGRPFHGIAR